MPTKTSKSKTVSPKPAAPRKPKAAAPRKLKIARYIAVTGDLSAAIKEYQTLLKAIAAGRKIDVKAFDHAITAMNKSGELFDTLSDKHEQAVLDYVDALDVK